MEKTGIKIILREVELPVFTVPLIPAKIRVLPDPARLVNGNDIGKKTLGPVALLLGNEPFQPIGGVHIVGVENRDKSAPGELQSPIQGIERILVLLVKVVQAGITVTLSHLTGSIRGAIIDHQQFQIFPALLQNAFNGLADKLFMVIGWYDDRYCWCHGWIV